MKKSVYLLTALILSLSAFAQTYTMEVLMKNGNKHAFPTDEITRISFIEDSGELEEYNILNPEIIPDDAVRDYINRNLADNSGYYSNIQVARYDGNITLSGANVRSLKGLELFSSLSSLKLVECTGVDVSTFPIIPSVKELELAFCKLNTFDVFSFFPEITTLIIPGNNFTDYAPVSENLRILACDQNHMRSLDISGTPHLYDLVASYNELTRLEVGIAALKELCVQENEAIGKIDFSYMRESLTLLNVANTGIKSLDLSGCINLEELECQRNKLQSSPDLSGCLSLKRLRIEGCGIESLDVTTLRALEDLNCYENNIASLNLSGLSNLKYVNAFNNGMTSINVGGCRSLVRLAVSYNQFSRIDLSDCSFSTLEDFRCIDSPKLRQVKVWPQFDLSNPPASWLVGEGVEYVYEFNESTDPEDPQEPDKYYTVSFNFTEPDTEGCIKVSIGGITITEPLTNTFRVPEGTSIIISETGRWEITEFKVNGNIVDWYGYRSFKATSDMDFSITAQERTASTFYVNIDNPEAISFFLDDSEIELEEGLNAIEFYPTTGQAYFKPNPGYTITSYCVDEYEFDFEGEDPIYVPWLNEGMIVTIATEK